MHPTLPIRPVISDQNKNYEFYHSIDRCWWCAQWTAVSNFAFQSRFESYLLMPIALPNSILWSYKWTNNWAIWLNIQLDCFYLWDLNMTDLLAVPQANFFPNYFCYSLYCYFAYEVMQLGIWQNFKWQHLPVDDDPRRRHRRRRQRRRRQAVWQCLVAPVTSHLGRW